jgi:hypothetical protein
MSGHSDPDNHANQMNPNKDAYWESRGYEERRDDWVEQSAQSDALHNPLVLSRARATAPTHPSTHRPLAVR